MKKELVKRVLTAIIGIPIAVGVLYLGGIAMAVTAIILSSICIYEYFNLFKHINQKVFKYSAYTINAALITGLYVILTQNGLERAGYTFFLALIPIFILTASLSLFNKDKHPLNSFSGSLSYIPYITIPFMALIILRMLYVSKMSFYTEFDLLLNDFFCAKFVIATFAAIWIGDSAAYFVGKQIGKHKIYRSVSPNKSWEGAIANLIFTVLGLYLIKAFFFAEFPNVHIIVIGLLIAVTGQIGDLFESKLKRHALIKDSSAILPGHGGLLDRLDSTLFVMPIVLFYILLVFTY
ncbi:MAG: phosphatidate cytidylyltransferase [bacterium]